MALKVLETLDDVKKDVAQEGQVIEEVNILFLDVSSTCTGYAVMKVDFTKKSSQLKTAGAIWLNNKKWEDQEKYHYISNAITGYFWIVQGVDYIVVEQYSVNPKKMVGVQVLPEITGAIKAAAQENGVKVGSILPQTWRFQLGIKPIVTKNSKGNNVRDYKTPTKDKVNETYDVPDTSISNMTGKERTTPSDLYDAIAIGLGWLKKYGLDKITYGEVEYNPHIGYNLDN